MAYKRDFATIRSRRNIAYLITEHYTEQGKPLIYISDDHVSELLISMVFSRGFPLYDHVNDLLIRLKSAGFIYMNYNRFRNIMNKKRAITKADNMALNLDEMKSPFGLLVIGLGLSCFAFLVELTVCVLCKQENMWISLRIRKWRLIYRQHIKK